MALVSFPSREAGWIASGKRFLECFVYSFFHVAVVVVTRFLVRSIRAHGVSSTNPHLFRLQSVCLFDGGARISARRRRLSSQHFSAPDLSLAVDDPPQCISKLPGPTTPWTKQPARMAQIRRVYDMGGSDRSPRRDLRPTDRNPGR